MTDVMAEIAAASHEQGSGIEQVNQAITQMDEATQQNAALVEEAAAAESMEEQARNLAQTVAVFKLDRHEEHAVVKVEKHAANVTHLPAKKAAAGERDVEKQKPDAAQIRKVANARSGNDAEWEEF